MIQRTCHAMHECVPELHAHHVSLNSMHGQGFPLEHHGTVLTPRQGVSGFTTAPASRPACLSFRTLGSQCATYTAPALRPSVLPHRHTLVPRHQRRIRINRIAPRLPCQPLPYWSTAAGLPVLELASCWLYAISGLPPQHRAIRAPQRAHGNGWSR